MATEMEKGRASELSHKEKGGGGFFQKLFREPGSIFGKTSGPPLDVIDRANELVVRADIPGLDQEDVSVEVDGRMLTIWGERHEEREERDESYYYAERWEGSFKRTIELPEGVDPTRACATFDSGVLEVCFPKTAPKTTGRRIEVSGPGQGRPTPQPSAPSEASQQPASGPSVSGAGPSSYSTSPRKESEPTTRRVEVTGAPSSSSSAEEPRIVTPPHTPAEDLGRH